MDQCDPCGGGMTMAFSYANTYIRMHSHVISLKKHLSQFANSSYLYG